MLETKKLLKIYRPQKGVPVKAIDGVSLKFPDKGMVFLLGKSGSGKSTLLNLLGGLDKYDGGEIIIKGVSSRDFKQSHFDSYRNTYVGFIFQEYNILEDFTVGANIALAIELQGRKANDDELNRILAEVDLAGYGNRKPNELSGGQKQRVAIARALVKNPKIIMADEPSGALDSATGKQVFDTLKKLSKEKLVIVVSHDRDFASEYADRIIELADGRVINDRTFCQDMEEETETEGIVFEGDKAKIPVNYRLTEEDRIAINEYLERLENGGELEFTEKKLDSRFIPTNQDEIKNEDKSPFELIKSKLSLKHAFKIGASGLKYKKFRLVMTILLSLVAFVLFGLVDTFSSYDHIKTTASSIYDTGVPYAAVTKNQKIDDILGGFWNYNVEFTDDELKSLSDRTGIGFSGVYIDDYVGYYYQFNLGSGKEESGRFGYDLYFESFSGIVEINNSALNLYGYSLVAGELPDGNKDEIAISTYTADVFKKTGYVPVEYDEKQEVYEEGNEIKITNYADMVGKTLLINDRTFTITGVVDTGFDWSRYASLLEESDKTDAADQMIDYALYNEFDSDISYSHTGMMMTGSGFIQRYTDGIPAFGEIQTGFVDLYVGDYYYSPSFFTSLSEIKDYKIHWTNGEKNVLADNEIIVSDDMVYELLIFDANGDYKVDPSLASKSFAMDIYDFTTGDLETIENVKIVGVIDTNSMKSNYYYFTAVSDAFLDKYCTMSDGIYDLVIGPMPSEKDGIQRLAEVCYTEENGVKYALNNPVSFELDTFDEIIAMLAKVFLYVGIFFAIFAAILLSNFIATSISYKKQEIGILRAIGSRGNDVFRIFFAEAFIIAMINFVLASLGTGALTAIINSALRNELGLLVTLLNFGLRQLLLLFGVSIGVAALASFLPVKKIASKRPIDAIRNR